MRALAYYAAQAGVTAVMFFAAGFLGRALWEDRRR